MRSSLLRMAPLACTKAAAATGKQDGPGHDFFVVQWLTGIVGTTILGGHTVDFEFINGIAGHNQRRLQTRQRQKRPVSVAVAAYGPRCSSIWT